MRIRFISSLPAAKRAGESGVAIVAVTVFTLVLLTLGATFLRLATLERLSANEEVQRAQSFYLAEAGVERAIAFLRAGNEHSTGALYTDQPFANGSYSVTAADDLARGVKIITSTGTFAGEQKTITVEVQLLPAFFKNTFSSGGDLEFYGIFAAAWAHGTTWLSGVYDSRGFFQNMGFDTLVEGVDPNETTLRFPDMDGDDIPNELEDFVLYFNNALLECNPGETDLIQTGAGGTVDIWPSVAYAGKKIIFVKGPDGEEDTGGNVDIYFGASWSGEQDLTIVSTGEVNYIQPLEDPATSRLSIISWGDYTEGAIIYSSHRSVIGTQTTADFTYLLTLASVYGSIFANQGINIQEAVVLVNFYHYDRLDVGDIPPGLRPLCTTNYYLGEIISWKEET